MKEFKPQNSPKGSCIFDPNTGLPNSPVSEELKKEWEKEFDDTFPVFNEKCECANRDVKSFISSIQQKTYEVAEKAGYERGRIEEAKFWSDLSTSDTK